jgi:hypothetical protein
MIHGGLHLVPLKRTPGVIDSPNGMILVAAQVDETKTVWRKK